MGKTSIEWCDHSINPIRARNKRTGAVGHYCEKIAPGCAHCYASNLQRRFQMPSFGGNSHERLPDNIEIFLDESKLQEVRRRKIPTRYFWEDMSDLFGWWVKREWIAKCFATMDDTPWHTHILVTKRPENIRPMWTADELYRRNVWLLTSIATQTDADRNIPHLLDCRYMVPVLGVSAEPLLGAINLQIEYGQGIGDLVLDVDIRRSHLDWVIVGGESGHNARPMHPDWARSLREQCTAAGVPFFFKQWGEWAPANTNIDAAAVCEHTHKWRLPGSTYHGPTSYRIGKKAAGRLLDGQEWNEFPPTPTPPVPHPHVKN